MSTPEQRAKEAARSKRRRAEAAAKRAAKTLPAAPELLVRKAVSGTPKPRKAPAITALSLVAAGVKRTTGMEVMHVVAFKCTMKQHKAWDKLGGAKWVRAMLDKGGKP